MAERPSLVRIMVSNTPIDVSTIDVLVSQLFINPILRSKVCVAISIFCIRFSLGEALMYTCLDALMFFMAIPLSLSNYENRSQLCDSGKNPGCHNMY